MLLLGYRRVRQLGESETVGEGSETVGGGRWNR